MDFEFEFPQEIDNMIALLEDGCRIEAEIIPREENHRTTKITIDGGAAAVAMATAALMADAALSIAARDGGDPMEGWVFITHAAKMIIEYNSEEVKERGACGQAD